MVIGILLGNNQSKNVPTLDAVVQVSSSSPASTGPDSAPASSSVPTSTVGQPVAAPAGSKQASTTKQAAKQQQAVQQAVTTQAGQPTPTPQSTERLPPDASYSRTISAGPTSSSN